MRRLRVGVVGVGHLGRHHARILAGLPDVELVGVADSRPEQAAAVAGPLGAAVHGDYRELIGRVDAVSVAVPTAYHRAVAGAFLEAGIPTLVEKPLASTLGEAEELVALADRAGVTFMVGHIERFNAALETWRALGWTPKYISAERLGTFTFRSTDIGVVHDLMIHDLDILLSLVEAPVKSVEAVGVSLFGDREDVANARIVFEDGCVASLTASRASLQATRKMRLWAADGYASLDFASRQVTVVRPSERLRDGHLDLEGLDLTQAAAIKEHVFGKMLQVDQVEDSSGGPDQLTLELTEFVEAVRGHRRPRVCGHDGLRAMRVAEQVLRSLNTHQWEGTPHGSVGPRANRSVSARSASHVPPPKLLKFARRERAGTSLVGPQRDDADGRRDP